jgi:precorrin-6B methylase 2
MNFVPTFSPAPLSYMAALRGVKPRKAGTAFTYAVVGCRTPDLLAALAASNPEGRFYGFMATEAACTQATENAQVRQVGNVYFFSAQPSELLAKTEKDMPSLNYLCCDESEKSLTAPERKALFDFAAKALQPGGLFVINYRTSADEKGILHFLVSEFAPEMNATQACAFLLDLKKLGGFYFKQHADYAAKLAQAIVRNVPDEFFSLFDKDPASSATFDTIVELGPRGFSYVGDSSIAASYIELSVPAEAQQTIVECRDNPLYESIKDFAQNRAVRSDIWCRQPAATSTDLAELFGGFTFGITLPRDKVPAELEVQGKTVPLNSPLYLKLIDLMVLMPVGVGDVLAHPNAEGFTAEDIIGAIQILAACGIARPMRGLHRIEHVENLTQPRLAGTFNQYLETVSLTGSTMPMSSPVLGDVITLSARDALVMQALDRVGLANSVSALLPELQRLAQNPSQAARVMNAEPTAESARQMIEDVVTESIIKWYAYGLLKAA